MKLREIEWIRPRDAVVLLSPLLGGDKAAKEVLAERLKDGLLTASARYMTEAIDVGSIPAVFTDSVARVVPAANDEVVPLDRGFPVVSATDWGSKFICWELGRDLKRRLILGGAVLSYSNDWERDVDRWDWSTGTFLFSKPPMARGPGANKHPARVRFPTRFVVYGVEFDGDAVDKIAQSFGGLPRSRTDVEALRPLCEPVPQERSKGGRKDAARWANFWNQATKLLVDGRLAKGFHSQAELREEIIVMMGSGAFGPDAIKKPVREIWQVYVEPTRR